MVARTGDCRMFPLRYEPAVLCFRPANETILSAWPSKFQFQSDLLPLMLIGVGQLISVFPAAVRSAAPGLTLGPGMLLG